MEEFDDNGCETLDEAARGDIPPSSRLWSKLSEWRRRDVRLLTNDQPQSDEKGTSQRNGRPRTGRTYLTTRPGLLAPW